ncbi:hypothetical protein [Marinitenerispora sediminis]|uniref:Uncharacterized protein n=1 Tax=Marinitenerispora sediminis TaxID=1931232 RepID=A0A368T786_9ACTN|nr:hypothetical protein [Marinitenerispora sediminis]RCV54646.1 hypothetical protein DEF23_15520 [Marinitenerispora sediminis]RCV56402.1 hypothetical protein DEF28_03595 [Marinitenerispora sediminis]RCV59746.1 hypothetical protein DEF24_08920 [Marinitenerispora sediminis]
MVTHWHIAPLTERYSPAVLHSLADALSDPAYVAHLAAELHRAAEHHRTFADLRRRVRESCDGLTHEQLTAAARASRRHARRGGLAGEVRDLERSRVRRLAEYTEGPYRAAADPWPVSRGNR